MARGACTWASSDTWCALQDKAVGRASTGVASGNRPTPQRDLGRWEDRVKLRLACMQRGKSRADGPRLFWWSSWQAVSYCGQECQGSHMPLHKAECTAKQATEGNNT